MQEKEKKQEERQKIMGEWSEEEEEEEKKKINETLGMSADYSGDSFYRSHCFSMVAFVPQSYATNRRED